ncbi:GNAT family N-acetyltransferase [Bosea sp. (in: a-proteobacteria)]|uniref:GNAT family N-acetyltransferase n=1 Tax=Bosea sp. (in: a-proteobacteria) TaxID=1871050 RepID=UPI002733435A|nr:GNAT family N-acetyltransferase [Bosea sp. (in: a-proteobacteria)]MDP3410653.1 GNAT family N-acetyltransferase [Bosea sp. (in: a-proteobacteria)]
MTLIIRPARPDEAGLVLDFIRALADYEKLADHVVATEAEIAEALFGDNPRAFCDIAEWEGEPAGFSVWFYTYSTFSGRHGIWLEDLFVHPQHRGRGLGKALIAALAKRCVAEGLPRLAWWVLNWNEPSRVFYRSLGAKAQDEWTVKRLDGEALLRLAEKG